MDKIRENIIYIKENIESLKKVDNVEIVAVTKTFPYQDVLQVLECGVKHIGESKIQEALPKFEQIGNGLKGVIKHFIGHLQSNKAKKAVENFDLIHSLDSLGLAKEISKYAHNTAKTQNCLIEVKVSQEETKTGIKPEEVKDFCFQCLEMPNISIKGLMVITPLSCNPEDSRPYFKQIYDLFTDMQNSFGKDDFNILSMGMSDDYKIAVEEGSNMVRIGSAIFGNRYYGNK
ncbi:MAG: YggS family pyridoxal phosphate-dependent enzyme [Endomicrobium sp.]|jgi:pyridoxal phosphate enzyme (YggS family)|nr:YggS family pyridoxal phosphate-dependent enzyme [Endomicrobium sp.]